MSADSLRKKSSVNHGGPRAVSGQVVRPHPVTEKTLMESVAGLINEVGLVSQPSVKGEDKQSQILWTRIERNNYHYRDLKTGGGGTDGHGNNSQLLEGSLIVTLGYPNGVQMWAVPPNGEAHEILSWKRPGVRLLRLLPAPISDLDKDEHRASRPIVALCEGSSTSSSTNHLTFFSLRSGEVLKSTKFTHPISDVLANSDAIVVTFLEKLVVFDTLSLDLRGTILTSEVTVGSPGAIPVSLGSSWLGFADRKVFPSIQSAGGVEPTRTPSYTATVLYAAKSLTKGLKGLGETVASSFAGHRPPVNPDAQGNSAPEPGVVTVVNLSELKSGELSVSEVACGASNSSGSHSSIVAHFVAHSEHPVLAMSFDPSGLLLVTADKGGHDFHVFRIHPHPLGSSQAAVHHLYVLHRGDTRAKVQDISFAPDSRWVAVSTLRGTTHIFPITPYGGAINVRTHTSLRVVNRLSRFQRTAGLDDMTVSGGGVGGGGRQSPVTTALTASGMNTGGKAQSSDLFHLISPYPNPRLPPFPHPISVPPMAQLRQSYMTLPPTSPKNSPPPAKAKGLLALEEKVLVTAVFDSPRGWIANSSPVLPCHDKRRKSIMDALFVLSGHGNLIEYSLEPKSQSDVPREKIADDTPVELSVHAAAQWTLPKPSFLVDLQPPFERNGFRLSTSGALAGYCEDGKHEGRGSSEESTSVDEGWLSQVEITTHAGPHRKIWMGPQFTFKVFNLPGPSKGDGKGLATVDVETVEVSVTNRPAKSNPVNMPIATSMLPEVMAGSSESSLDQSPHLVDPYCETDPLAVTNDSAIKENLAEAMMENNCAGSGLNKGGCQSLGSCDDDLSSSSFESASQNSVDAPLVPTFCIDTGFPD